MRNPKNPYFSDTPVWTKEYKTYGCDVRTDVLSAEDWLGNRFAPGDRVMYCIGAGRGQMMAIGEVQQMRAVKRKRLLSYDWETVSETGHKRRTNEVWEDYWDVEVQVLTLKTSGSWNNNKRSRPAWVNPMNITSLKFDERLVNLEVNDE